MKKLKLKRKVEKGMLELVQDRRIEGDVKISRKRSYRNVCQNQYKMKIQKGKLEFVEKSMEGDVKIS